MSVASTLLNKLNPIKDVIKKGADYLKAPNQSPQNFIRSYEDNLTKIGSARDSNFNLTRFCFEM